MSKHVTHIIGNNAYPLCMNKHWCRFSISASYLLTKTGMLTLNSISRRCCKVCKKAFNKYWAMSDEGKL